MFISFGAAAKDYKFQCSNLLFKIEDPFFGKKKLYTRTKGKWEKLCTQKGSQITKDSFNCIVNNGTYKRFLLDEVTSEITLNFLNGKTETYSCFKRK